jgi:uncharacterized LabA/DUF88 family protein
MSAPTVAVFIDYQNLYRRARDCFFPLSSAHYEGQVSPRAVGDEIVHRVAARNPGASLAFVRVYRGLPDGGRDAKGHAACAKQVAAWSAQALVHPVTRPLRYPNNYPTEKPKEKGIDVQIALDFVLLALDKKFDLGVLFSADTDLRPAIEEVRARTSVKVDVAAWQPPTGYGSRLTISGAKIWCHFFDQKAYAKVADLTDYNA